MESKLANMLVKKGSAVIVADGSFPVHDLPLNYLHKANYVIACDGAADSLLARDINVNAVVGDLDSLSMEGKEKLREMLHPSADQETNDLTKAVHFALSQGIEELIILGASGKREDHTLGNMGLLFEYGKLLKVNLITDSGIYFTSNTSFCFAAEVGQQLSIFSNRYDAAISSQGLKYPLNKLQLKNWWMGTLNEVVDPKVEITFDKGEVLIGLIFSNGK